MKIEINNNTLLLYIDKEIYSINVIHKCFYWYSVDFSIDIEDYSDKQYIVRLNSKNKVENLPLVLERIKTDIIDFKLRDIVTNETKEIRELLIAKAFAYYEDDDTPSTDVSDPVGFNPKSIK